MPREIADSDAESDLDSPPRPSASPIPENVIEAQPSTLEQDPWANLEFDQFLSPTQRLSSAIERQEKLHAQSPSSTDRFLQEIAQGDEALLNSFGHTQGLDGSLDNMTRATPRNKTKRTITEIEYGSSRTRHGDQAQQRPVKRAKTYGSSRSQNSNDDFLFSGTSDRGSQQSQGLDKQRISNPSESTSNELPVQRLVNPNSIETSKSSSLLPNSRNILVNYQQGSTSFHSGNIHNASVTKSFTGGYQGINLDFRGAGLSLEMGANPFGSLSQVSLEGDVNQAQAEKFASLFQHSQQSIQGDMHNNEIDSTIALQKSHLNEMATSPLRVSNVVSEGTHSGHLEKLVHDINQTSESVSTIPSNHILLESHGQSGKTTEQMPKKRGRKPKHSHSDVQATMPDGDAFRLLQQEDPLDLPSEKYKPRPSRSRAGTVESVQSQSSQESQESQAAENATHKKRRPTVPEPAVLAESKQVSSELNLSDPAMIGVPKEMYVPRPSKSRSKRVVDGGDDEDELQRSEDPIQIQSPKQTVESSLPANTKKKPGRKGKVKRAKTSAAALLKSAEMYDEDDKDCILVDEVPVKVKMAPLPEISPVKQEPVELGSGNEQEEHQDRRATKNNEGTSEPQTEVKISIDIPNLPKPDAFDSATSKPEPKKRGRKPKKKAEEQMQAVAATGEAEDKEPTIHHEETTVTGSLNPRPILSEKDLNIPIPATTISPPSPVRSNPQSESLTPQPSPKKPVHSPLKPKSTSTCPPAPSTRESTPTTSNGSLWTKPRVGLSRRSAIPSLLRKLDRSREPPKTVERKQKLSKRQQEEEDRRRLEAEDAGEVYRDRWEIRGKDGMLVEWDE